MTDEGIHLGTVPGAPWVLYRVTHPATEDD